MNRISKVSRKYVKMKPGIDKVRAANAQIRRSNKLRRLARDKRMASHLRAYEMGAKAAQGQTISAKYSRETLEGFKKPELIKIGRVYKIKGLDRLKKDHIIGEILSAQESVEVVDA